MRAKSAGHSGADADAFDRWLRRSLRSEFEAVAMEPVPEALLRVLDEALGKASQARGPEAPTEQDAHPGAADPAHRDTRRDTAG